MLYENVLELANKKGISISEVERRANISKGTISKWRTSNPRISSLKSVADVFGVTVNRLMR